MAILKEVTIETVNNMCSFLEQDSFVDTALEHGRSEIEVTHKFRDVKVKALMVLSVYKGC